MNEHFISNELFKSDDFPALGQPSKQPKCPPRGWEIAAAHIPQLRTSREILKKESVNLEITGDIPHGSLDAMKEILVQRFNKSMSPILIKMESVETLLLMTFLRFMIFLKRRKILLWPDSIQNPLRNLSTSTGKNLFQVKRNQAGICTSPLTLIKKTRPIN